ncbi:fumarylacetoacetate hydrolase family protein [Desulfolutivibrio sp.]|uniref:fumarylacetoacetate hydrolase family protein n=1 Tax=Desulfolutivibrio sp. TaxID=2773296 RepID=UPI002F96E57F
MRVLRVRHQDKSFYASLLEDHVVCLDRSLSYDKPIPLSEIQLLPPVAPTKVVCAAVNYRSHAAEVGREVPDEPVLFLKPPSAVIPAGQPIVLPRASARVDYEAELAVVMGRPCRNVPPEKVAAHIFGYTCANDVTARDLQNKDGLYGRAKGFDTFAPIGPWIETEAPDPGNLAIRTLVNGEVRQEGDTSDMIFPVAELVSFISRVMTLQPGDVILTGTPPGIGPLAAGDEVRIEIAGVGVLINPVVAEEETAAGGLIQ